MVVRFTVFSRVNLCIINKLWIFGINFSVRPRFLVNNPRKIVIQGVHYYYCADNESKKMTCLIDGQVISYNISRVNIELLEARSVRFSYFPYYTLLQVRKDKRTLTSEYRKARQTTECCLSLYKGKKWNHLDFLSDKKIVRIFWTVTQGFIY